MTHLVATIFPSFSNSVWRRNLSKTLMPVFRIGTEAPDDVIIALDCRFNSENCEPLNRLLALSSQGFVVSNLFPKVTLSLPSFKFVPLVPYPVFIAGSG
jgi:hypothetical protein